MLISSVIITVVYWIVALWYTNKTSSSKDLVVFHFLFDYASKWSDLWQYVYQFCTTVILFWGVPLLITKYYLKQDFSEFGLKFLFSKQALIICVVVYPLVVISTYFSSQELQIAAEYPLSKLVGTSWLIFASYQSVYLFYFVAYEIFYRGYLQFGLKSEQPSQREIVFIVLFQTVLTTFFHIGKPSSEIFAAAVFGPVFGFVAFRYNSIWYGMAIHFLMNVSLDMFSLYWLKLLPQKFF